MSDPELQKLADDRALKCLDYVAIGRNNASQSVAVSFSQHILRALRKVQATQKSPEPINDARNSEEPSP